MELEFWIKTQADYADWLSTPSQNLNCSNLLDIDTELNRVDDWLIVDKVARQRERGGAIRNQFIRSDKSFTLFSSLSNASSYIWRFLSLGEGLFFNFGMFLIAEATKSSK